MLCTSMESSLLLLTCTCTAKSSFSQLHQLNEPQLAKLIRTQLVLVPDSPPKGGGGSGTVECTAICRPPEVQRHISD